MSQPQSPQWYPPPSSRKQGLSTGAIVAIAAGVVVVVILVGAVIAGAFLAGIQQSSNLTLSPTVTHTSPVLGVPVDSTISATFSKAMNPSTISTSTFTIVQGSTSVSGTVTYAGTTASFKPSANLALNTYYTATITTGAKDLVGNALKNDYVWIFLTSKSSGACAQATVDLKTASNFAILGASGVTNTGSTTITGGDVGASPGTSINGFPPGTIIGGAVHAGNDIASKTAQTDATNAYNAVSVLTGGTTENGNIGGMTLTCGLYTVSSSLSVSSGDLTLDAQGNGNAVFIFQIASTLTTSPGRQVILTGGAQAKNIFWIVGSSATIDTTSVFQGTILAYSSVTLNYGATLNGRALTQVAAVTLNGNTITKPAL